LAPAEALTTKTFSMKLLLYFETLGIFLLTCFLIYQLNLQLAWWAYLLLFFSPDIGMLGYLAGTKIGAYTYNIFHHQGLAIVFALTGYLLHNDLIIFTGLLLLAHSSFDRLLGYGLKYNDNFKHTHLGWMGQSVPKE